MRALKIAFFFILISVSGFSQETVIYNSCLIENNPKSKFEKGAQNADTINLPFFDDFSRYKNIPDTLLWADNNVYINTNYVQTAPSIGVATFDAINSTGNFYPGAFYETNTLSDILTSQAIDLNFPNNKSIFLSFFYMPQGLGDQPETEDSLMLEFLSVDDFKWNKIWSVPGEKQTEFKLVMLQISDEKYLKKGFRFRFSNYTSPGSKIYSSLAGNTDHWHIDYVYLNKNRSEKDTIFHDIAFSSPMLSILKDYQSMPWEHFKTNPEKFMSGKISVQYTNNDNKLRLIDSINFTVTDRYGSSSVQKLEAGAYNVPPSNSSALDVNTDFKFISDASPYEVFDIKANIKTSTFDSVVNNTILYEQSFIDFYAYDDGSAEAGYGLTGTGTKYSSVAYKFKAEKPDNLKSIQMYFNRTIQDASQQYFWLNIWKQNPKTRLPENEPIISIEGKRPEYADELNKFYSYNIPEKLILEDTFYIGWTQTTEDMLNIGLDKNTNSKKKLYFNVSGVWEQSQINGSIMIRPVFGENSVTEINPVEKSILSIYPNPADDILFYKTGDTENINKIIITDIFGRIHIEQSKNTEEKINISRLSPGIYFIEIIQISGKSIKAKFIKI